MLGKDLSCENCHIVKTLSGTFEMCFNSKRVFIFIFVISFIYSELRIVRNR